ncbi:MAG: DUF805 domain-containing protein [Pseudomonadota bacterium]
MRKSVIIVFTKYFDFSGRAPRSEFWFFALFYVLFGVLLTVLNSVLFGPELVRETVTVFSENGGAQTSERTKLVYNSGWLGPLFNLLIFIPLLAVAWRRMHDAGKPGWFVLVPIGCFIGITIGALGLKLGFTNLAMNLWAGQKVTVKGDPHLFWLLLLTWLICVIVLVGWLAKKSEPIPNKWGAPN